jgi:hypothetical protein
MIMRTKASSSNDKASFATLVEAKKNNDRTCCAQPPTNVCALKHAGQDQAAPGEPLFALAASISSPSAIARAYANAATKDHILPFVP